jgi:hypothetical protein
MQKLSVKRVAKDTYKPDDGHSHIRDYEYSKVCRSEVRIAQKKEPGD